MKHSTTRRSLFQLASSAGFLAAAEQPPAVPESFPMQPSTLVREMVRVAHGDLDRVKQLVTAHPALAKAAIDWGFGDWESALGAASHTGSREIAQLLIANGARPSLFSATMLGQLEVVRAFLAAQPGAQRIPGPHGISLLAHAKMGGAPAEPVYRYLESLGDAGTPPAAPLTDEAKAALAGSYRYGRGATERITVSVVKGGLQFEREGTVARGLYHHGEGVFHPAGAEAVRIRFSRDTLTVHDPDLVLTARKE